jgi:hypothetical protein
LPTNLYITTYNGIVTTYYKSFGKSVSHNCTCETPTVTISLPWQGSKMVTVGVYILVTPKEEEEEERTSNY